MRKLKCSQLVLDFDFYPRAQVDSQHVAYMVEAMKAGSEFPPVVICKKTKRVADGFHRVRARQRHDGPDAEIQVVEKTYRNDAELFLDAMRYNAAHGRNLTQYDRAHCAILAVNLGLDDEAIAGALHVPAEKIGELRADRSAKHAGLQVPIKRTIRHMAGRTLNKGQVAANAKLSGMNQVFYVHQVCTLIESGLLNTDDAALMAALEKLRELLAGVLEAETVGSG